MKLLERLSILCFVGACSNPAPVVSFDAGQTDSGSTDSGGSADVASPPNGCNHELIKLDTGEGLSSPKISSDGSRFLVAWTADDGLMPSPVRVVDAALPGAFDVLSFNGFPVGRALNVVAADSAVVWIEQEETAPSGSTVTKTDIFAQRFQGGEPLGDIMRLTDSEDVREQGLSVVRDGTRYLMAWWEFDSGMFNLKIGSFDSGGLANVSVVTRKPTTTQIQIVAQGDTRIVAYFDTNGSAITGHQISSSLEASPVPVTLNGTPGSPPTGNFDLRMNERGGMIAFDSTYDGSGEPRISTRFLNLSGTINGTEKVVQDNDSESNPGQVRLGTFAGGYLAVYDAVVGGESEVRTAFVHGGDGQVVERIELGISSAPGGVALGVVADNFGQTGVAWVKPLSGGATTADMNLTVLSCYDVWLSCSPE